MNELAGEKIDLIAYHEDPLKLISNSLSPAIVSQIKITDAEAKKAVAFVPESQFAIAIGKEGQNLDLASRLIGWGIEIKSQIEKKSGDGAEALSIEGLSSKTMDLLVRAGLSDVHKISQQSVESLTQVEGITEKMAAKIITKAKASLEKGS
jgi:N utilization substance protein A